jgi:hypothetical protein
MCDQKFYGENRASAIRDNISPSIPVLMYHNIMLQVYFNVGVRVLFCVGWRNAEAYI